MAFEGNIAGLLGMSNKSDGTGDYQPQRGSYKERLDRRERQYYQQTQNIDPDTGEVLDFKPNKNLKNPYTMTELEKLTKFLDSQDEYDLGKFKYQPALSRYKELSGKRYGGKSLFSMPKINFLQPNKILDIAIIGAICYGAYLVYLKILKPLGNSPLDNAKDKAENIVGQSYVDSTAAAVQNNKATATSLANTKGLNISSLHTKNALLLHDLMNSTWVNDSEVVKVVKGMSIPTFQLTAAAYGTQNLNTYAKSPSHLLTAAAWSDLFSSDKLVGTLKKHLTITLSSSELSSISQWLNSIT